MFEQDNWKIDCRPQILQENLYEHKRLTGVVVRPQKSDAAPRPIRFHKLINCAGAWAGEIAALSGIGHGPNLLAVPIPVLFHSLPNPQPHLTLEEIEIEARKRYVFVVHCPEGPGILMPHLVDPTGPLPLSTCCESSEAALPVEGVWARRVGEGDLYYVGKNPSAEEDAGLIDHANLDVDYDFFHSRIWPVLAARVPAFKNLKVPLPFRPS